MTDTDTPATIPTTVPRWKKYYDKEYFRQKQEDRRKHDPLLQKQVVYVVELDGKKYALLQKSQLKIEKMLVSEFKNATDIIKCF